MRVAIYDVDSKIPNLALMRLSAYHKERGDDVEAYSPLFKDHYDHIYASSLMRVCLIQSEWRSAERDGIYIKPYRQRSRD